MGHFWMGTDKETGGTMDAEIKAALVMIEKKLEAIEERVEAIADEVSDIKEELPANLDEDVSEIKSLLIQMT